VYTGLSWTPSPRKPAEAKPNPSQLYLSRLSLAKAAELNFFKTPASVYPCDAMLADTLAYFKFLEVMIFTLLNPLSRILSCMSVRV
jgi:hypothetical protein